MNIRLMYSDVEDKVPYITKVKFSEMIHSTKSQQFA